MSAKSLFLHEIKQKLHEYKCKVIEKCRSKFSLHIYYDDEGFAEDEEWYCYRCDNQIYGCFCDPRESSVVCDKCNMYYRFCACQSHEWCGVCFRYAHYCTCLHGSFSTYDTSIKSKDIMYTDEHYFDVLPSPNSILKQDVIKPKVNWGLSAKNILRPKLHPPIYIHIVKLYDGCVIVNELAYRPVYVSNVVTVNKVTYVNPSLNCDLIADVIYSIQFECWMIADLNFTKSLMSVSKAWYGVFAVNMSTRFTTEDKWYHDDTVFRSKGGINYKCTIKHYDSTFIHNNIFGSKFFNAKLSVIVDKHECSIFPNYVDSSIYNIYDWSSQ